jgi:N-acyl-D-amino-acid deacylase
MKLLVQNGMEAGAFGLSSGLGYAPGNYADLDEMVELCKVVAQFGGVYSSHIREQSREIINSWKEIVKTAELSGVHGHIAHVQIIGKQFWGASKDLVDILKAARSRGVNISCDGYPYESGATTIVGALIPNWVQAEGKMKARLKDPDLLPGIKKEIEMLLDLRGGGKSVLITSCPQNHLLQKRYLDDIALDWKLSPVEAVLKIAKEFDDSRAIYFHSSEIDKGVFFSDPYCAVGSDSFCVLNDLLNHNLVHPRSYGTMPAFLAEYVKKKKTITPEEGIRKMTTLPAEILGIKDRGQIIEGKKADLVVCDYEKVSDNSSYVDPHKYPSGIDYVLVNGDVVVEKGVCQKTLPGQVLYGPACN